MKESIFVIAMGIVLWIIAFVFAIVMNADSKVLWICVAGAVFGAVGLRYTIKRGRKGFALISIDLRCNTAQNLS